MILLDKKSWSGVWTALVTPFKKVGSDFVVDEVSLKSLIDVQIKDGISGFVIAGSTGEGSLLGLKRYRELLRHSKKIVGDRVPLVAGLGIGGTESAVEHAQIAKEMKFDGVLAVPPAYIKAPQRGLIRHFLTLAEVGLPVCLYEVSSRTAQSIAPSTIQELLESRTESVKNIVAIKDASGDMSRMVQCRKLLGDRISFLSGDDGTFVPFLSLGGSGIISVVSHLIPQKLVKINSLCNSGRYPEANQIQSRIQPFVDACFFESNPVPCKSILFALEKISEPDLLPPLVPMNSEKLKKALEIYKELED